MIVALRGILEGYGPDHVIVGLHGLSLRVYVSTATLSQLGAPGEEIHLHTHLQVREDDLTLYGFASTAELSLFQMLLGVSGVGPKAALALLSAMSPEELSAAIANERTDLLTRVPGIGKKVAGRLILELKGKVTAPPERLAPPPEDETEVVAALAALGYSQAEISAALADLPHSPDLTTEDKIRLALQHFTSP